MKKHLLVLISLIYLLLYTASPQTGAGVIAATQGSAVACAS
jgi:hypothetical protein